MIINKGKYKNLRETHDTSYATNFTWSDMGLNLKLNSEKPESHHLSHGITTHYSMWSEIMFITQRMIYEARVITTSLNSYIFVDMTLPMENNLALFKDLKVCIP